MFRLLSFVAFAILLVLVVGVGPHKAPLHTAHLDRLELPPAVSSASALKSASNLNTSTTTVGSIVRTTPRVHVARYRTALPESISLRDPLTASSVLRV